MKRVTPGQKNVFYVEFKGLSSDNRIWYVAKELIAQWQFLWCCQVTFLAKKMY